MIKAILRDKAKRLAGSMLHVSPELKIPPADIHSRLDATVQRYGLDATERFFRESRGAQALARAMSRYLGDSEGERSLKKGFHVKQEQRARIIALRLDPPLGPVAVPDGWHPLDRRTADGIIEAGLHHKPIATPIPFGSRILLAVSPLVWGVAFLVRASTILVRFSGRPAGIKSTLAAHDFLRPYVLGVFCDYVTRTRTGNGHDVAPLTIVNERSGPSLVNPAVARTVDVAALRIPAARWITVVMLPGLRLFTSVLWIAVSRGGDARVLTLAAIAMRQAFHSLPIWRVAFNVRFRYFLDIVEYNELHILKGIIFRKFGGGVARWPTSSIDSPGSITSYLGYDIFFSPGPYQVDTYGETWWPACRSVSVGFLHHDPRFGSGTDVADPYRTAIEERIGAGKRLIALFGSSDASPASFGAAMIEMLTAVREVTVGRNDYFVVIKPKGRKGEYLHAMLENESRLRDWIGSSDVISVHYDEGDREVCGAGWLIDQMTVGIGDFGTVMTEALAHGRPYYAYFPVFASTRMTEKMTRDGFLHDDTGSFRRALGTAVHDPYAITVPTDWIRSNFDPYDDGKALARVVDALLYDPEKRCSTMQHIPRLELDSNTLAPSGTRKEPANG